MSHAALWIALAVSDRPVRDWREEGLMTSVTDLVDRQVLLELAGTLVFDRGVDYYEDGRVELFDLLPRRVTAEVAGTETYDVELRATDSGLDWSCTCPYYAEDGAFCKHCVAVALDCRPPAHDPRAQAPQREGDLRATLLQLPPETLVDLLLDEAAGNPRLRATVTAKAARDEPPSSTSGPFLWPFLTLLDDALDVGDYVDYRETHSVARRAGEALERIAALLEDGHATAVIELAEHALELLEDAISVADDSNGELGGLLHDAQGLHLAACIDAAKRGAIEPVALADRLFAWELSSDWEVFLGAAATYAGVLGEAGLARYRALAEPVWAGLPTLAPGDVADRAGHSRRFRITTMMEALARDLDELIAVRSKDLSSPYGFLRIAEACREGGADDRALEWAERGAETFASSRDARLRDFLAEEYQCRGRHAEALELTWSQLTGRPCLETYRALRDRAERAGQWAAWRGKALDALRDAGGPAPDRATTTPFGPRGRSELVKVLLSENEVDDAWAEATTGGCTPDLWLQLARKREETHPDDAAAVYLDRLEPTIAGTNNAAYEHAVQLLGSLERCLAAAGRRDEFAQVVARIRAIHKRKRNLMALMDRAGW